MRCLFTNLLSSSNILTNSHQTDGSPRNACQSLSPFNQLPLVARFAFSLLAYRLSMVTYGQRQAQQSDIRDVRPSKQNL